MPETNTITDVASVEFDEHRWCVNIKVTLTDGTVKEWVASADSWYADSGIYFATRDEYEARAEP